MNTKFGTSVNKRKIVEPFKLCNGDVIEFGKNSYCKYVFLDAKFEVQIDKQIQECTKTSLETDLKYLNVNVVENYHSSCSHYVIEKVTLDTLEEQTIFLYLIDRKTVITPKYFEDLLTNIKEAPLLPNLYRYMPEIDEDLISKGVDDIPRKRRRYLFENVMCVFFNAACEEKLSTLILKCGGDTIMYTQDEEFLKLIESDIKMYIAVNHNPNGKKTPLIRSFSRTMKQQKKKVFATFCVNDIYISILKGRLDTPDTKLRIDNDSSTAPTRISEDSDYNQECDLHPIDSRIHRENYDIHQNAANQNNDSNFVKTISLNDSNGNKWITRVRKFNCPNTSVSNADTNSTMASPNLKNAKKNYGSVLPADNVKSSVQKDVKNGFKISTKSELVIKIDDDEDDDDDDEKGAMVTNQTAEALRKNCKPGLENKYFPIKRRHLVINPFSRQKLARNYP